MPLRYTQIFWKQLHIPEQILRLNYLRKVIMKSHLIMSSEMTRDSIIFMIIKWHSILKSEMVTQRYIRRI